MLTPPLFQAYRILFQASAWNNSAYKFRVSDQIIQSQADACDIEKGVKDAWILLKTKKQIDKSRKGDTTEAQ